MTNNLIHVWVNGEDEFDEKDRYGILEEPEIVGSFQSVDFHTSYVCKQITIPEKELNRIMPREFITLQYVLIYEIV